MTEEILGYVAKNYLGVTLRSFGKTEADLTYARQWVKANRLTHQGLRLYVQKLTTTKVPLRAKKGQS